MTHCDKPTYSVIVDTGESSKALHRLIAPLIRSDVLSKQIDLIVIEPSLTSSKPAFESFWQLGPVTSAYRKVYIPCASLIDRLRAQILAANGDWIFFVRASNLPILDLLIQADCVLKQPNASEIGLIFFDSSMAQTNRIEPIKNAGSAPMNISACLLRRNLFLNSLSADLGHLHPGFIEAGLIARYLLAMDPSSLMARLPASISMPPVQPDKSCWKLPGVYSDSIGKGYVTLLHKGSEQFGHIPRWLQQHVALSLRTYFITDLLQSAPTRALLEHEAENFHALVSNVMSMIDVAVIEGLRTDKFDEVLATHALLSYKNINHCSSARVTKFDQAHSSIRITYLVLGEAPRETCLVNDLPVDPTDAKYRSCNFFHRTLFLERVLWLSCTQGSVISINLNDEPIPIIIAAHGSDEHPGAAGVSYQAELADIESAFPVSVGGNGPRPYGLPGLMVRFTRLVARLPIIRKVFKSAWVFVDHENEADDNAEHLYRWVKKNHPEINAWFLLAKSSSDWKRLRTEGFKLMARGWIRKLLLLNCEYVISSHADFSSQWYIRRNYKENITWKFIYLQHGVSYNDISHWYNTQSFDLVFSSARAEYNYFIRDNTPYLLTTKEVKLTGLPRHDALYKLHAKSSQEEPNIILVMPTWRSSLNDAESWGIKDARAISRFSSTKYARHWGDFLRSNDLREICERHQKILVFMPHPNAVPYLRGFNLPPDIIVLTKQEIGIQALFNRTAVLVTDYSSVAFDLAYIRRPTLYYNFDDSDFYIEHNWRKGFFDLKTNGFGPVSTTLDSAISSLNELLNKCSTESSYHVRMDNFFEYRDCGSCRRVYDSIIDIETCKPYRSAHNL